MLFRSGQGIATAALQLLCRVERPEAIEEIKKIKERADTLLAERVTTLEKVAGLSREDAKGELVRQIERENEEDFMVRMQKLEQNAEERLSRRAKDILATSIQRLASSTASEIMTTNAGAAEQAKRAIGFGAETRTGEDEEATRHARPITVTGASGDPTSGTPGQNGLGSLMQGSLESSNVEVVQEMIGLIRTQRAYEVNSKAVQTADEMLQISNNLKR